ncbi:hypothetical protein GGTG_00406 [Gaeumannomyces tritici R3-111a-1]|uniref:Uncharacterized protein n=1 Tax=Gaeumannomyces tritici (strain R3-111a-1) TaxID=644352 RepID=J3NGL7_GAET3|nr:hypothetical protein GGTG_00406 [Gaeumannomyces tritici R3-111a-1]EJT80407.1 hypothetical protein GGTG_00406 [Gaeumannomyces tritici R3-111a-1]
MGYEMGSRLGNIERMTARPWVTAPPRGPLLWVLLFLALMAYGLRQEKQQQQQQQASSRRTETGARYEARHRAQTQGRQRQGGSGAVVVDPRATPAPRQHPIHGRHAGQWCGDLAASDDAIDWQYRAWRDPVCLMREALEIGIGSAMEGIERPRSGRNNGKRSGAVARASAQRGQAWLGLGRRPEPHAQQNRKARGWVRWAGSTHPPPEPSEGDMPAQTPPNHNKQKVAAMLRSEGPAGRAMPDSTSTVQHSLGEFCPAWVPPNHLDSPQLRIEQFPS